MDKLINDFSVGVFFWITLLFLILIFVLKKFAWKPILTAIEERENGIEEALLQAEKAREEMKALKAENEQIMQQAREERDAMLKEAKAMKEREVEAAREIAEIEADKIIEAARRTIESEKNLAIAEVKNQVASLSLEVAEKVLRDNLKSEDQQKNLVDKLINEIKLS
ncbi:F0F1 ATP synthase subunit B [Ornithobacterium rhinotracheale]|uniref:ATP synthase subunit b n=1 Tax=Ornithobacterium rhinotracheale (strain ATCC 51463 / DSM 15997 / CCUG 23171 / CIP 104009 / LMG 9086) TaxID=867902 RepID=I3ZY44_ORNRL|nr:F0F1 ATP synthase subunit B [Ornithobacterium rhinotracheale]AFL96628.1 ATP synthase F0 subcomplex B subunit [Ornithobacterium rhinotracheale DSM 15997]AIP98794.1 F0F1 ATP synthase subunit B [Ornithobacterium rhinotracheale ORT-UMN 88]KGB67546.1 F0F1 ATP synthase subunit B [Ornithobacterium rhinotracheale H06-030791]MCK0195246.1 F0F1 ATP synthase subunit B [Ornithobacterium rhinotracheale]UOH62812.1 F0F1 ATP synthase subunit B [Ornithobacterium rhinotracheale]